MSKLLELTGGVFFIVLVLIFVLIGPWFTMLALNTLFGLSIPVTVWTWLSAFWLSALIGTSAINSNKSK